uniref:Uncharacterized protein n=1 Tax=Rhizophora mucronata TaxID=61149 RepID=A0A2P2NV51_RHIMU
MAYPIRIPACPVDFETLNIIMS